MNVLRRLVNSGLVAWFLVSAVSQYPDDSYARIRRSRLLASNFLIPNWKFFAPNPGIDDYVLLYRTGSEADGAWSDWQRLLPVAKRKLSSAFYSPESRFDKGVLDIVSTMKLVAPAGPDDERFRACKSLLMGCVRTRMRPRPGDTHLQVMVVRASGYEDSLPPKYDLVFTPEPIEAAA